MSLEKQLSITSWMEVAVHTHMRLGELIDNPQEKLVEDSLNIGQWTVKGFLEYAQLFLGSQAQIVDTDHPFNILDLQGISRKECYSPARIVSTIDVISQGILERAQVLRHHFTSDCLLTGVEANILNAQGLLDISNSVLNQLDVVIASFHRKIWKGANESTLPTKSNVLESILEAVKNPYVDILGHPIRDVPNEIVAEMTPNDWEEIFVVLKEKAGVFEINISDLQLNSMNFYVERSLIKKAAGMGLKFCLGLDFHNFHNYGGRNIDGIIDQARAETVFQQGRHETHFRMMRKLGRLVRELIVLGVTPEIIINSSKITFQEWLLTRHVQKQLRNNN